MASQGKKLIHGYIRKINIKKCLVEIFVGITKYDFLLLSFFPILISAVMFLPESIQINLRLHLQNPSWWQFYTASFVHQGIDHFKGNITILISFLIVGFLLANAIGEKNRYKKLLYITLIVFPFVESIVSFFLYKKVPIVKVTSGSSGLVSAILAFIPILIYKRLSRHTQTKILSHRVFVFLMFTFLTIFVAYYFVYIRIFSILVFLVLFSISSFFFAKNELKRMFFGIQFEAQDNLILTWLIITSIIMSPIVFLLLFPKQVISSTGFVGFLIHFLGFIFGLYTAFYFFRKSLAVHRVS